MKTTLKFLSVFSLIALILLTFAAPAQAFDSRSGETVVIKAGEVIEDDLYVSAAEFTLDGTVKGDLIVSGGTIIMNGTVDGDFMAAGQTIIINGTVADDARIAGAILQVGEKANIGDDLIAAGASLETKDGSKVGGDVVVGAGQALLAGSGVNLLAGVGALEIRGEFSGDVKAEVGDPQQDNGGGPPMSAFMSMFTQDSQVSVPDVAGGLKIAEGAKIKGDLEYTQKKEIKIPANIVGGKTTRKEPVVDPASVEVTPTLAEAAMTWTFNLLRSIVTLIIFGLLLGWLAPIFMKMLMEKLQTKTAASLGWGFVTYAAFFFAIFVIIIAMIAGGVLFGMLSLNGISATIIWVGILAIFALGVAFALATTFISKVAVAWLGGKLILDRLNPAMADHKFIPLILGVVILAVLMAIPYIGWVFSLLAVITGLGAIWIWGNEAWQSKKTAQ